MLIAGQLSFGAVQSEDFSYSNGNLVGSGDWVATTNGGTGSNIQVGSGAVSLATSGLDAHLPLAFTAPNPGSTYAGFDVDISAAQATGDAFISFGGTNSNDCRGRLFAKSSGAGYVLGYISGTSGSPVYGSTVLSFNTIYRVVMRYDMVTGSSNNTGRFYINPADVTTEGSNTPEVTVSFAGGLEYSGGIAGITLLQGNASNAPTVASLDNLAVSDGFSGGAGDAWWLGIDEDFSSSVDDFSSTNGTWTVSGGRYVLSSPTEGGTGLLGNISVNDVVFSGDYYAAGVVNVTGTGSDWNDVALVFGYQDSSNYYYVSLNESNDGNTMGLFKVVSGTPTQMVDFNTYSFTSDTDYVVEVKRTGSSIVVIVNDTLLASTTDSTFTGGRFGFGTKNDSAEFDDLFVTDIPVIDEGFASSASNFTVEITGGTWGVSSGRYVLSSPASGGTGLLGNLSAHNTSLSHSYEISGLLRITGTGGDWDDAAIVFGYQDEDNYYYVSLNESNDTNTKGIFKVVGGTPTQLADITISVASDTDYPIEISRSGANITAYVNSSQVATATDSTFTGGRVGFGSKNDGAQFDNLVVVGKPGSGSVGGGGGGGSSGPPTEVSSFGPNGTHWPSIYPTPFMYDSTVTHIEEVACSWSAIASAISGVSSTEAAEGYLILVQPGTLSGNGNGSTSTPVLQNLGSGSWSKRITVAPRDGFGSVTCGECRIFNVQGVCFAGFEFEGLAFHANNRSALAWTKVEVVLTGNGYTDMSIYDVEFVEVVIPDAALSGTDTSMYYSSGASVMDNYRFTGCYFAPRYRPINDAGHTDTMQFWDGPGVPSAEFSNVHIRDCAIFAGSNASIQDNGIDGSTTGGGLILEHSYLVGRPVAQSRYPFPSGADTGTGQGEKCFNGDGEDMNVFDSYVIGGVSVSTGGYFHEVQNSKTPNTVSGAATPSVGGWTVDGTLSSTNPTMPPYPTDTYLDSIWNP